MHVLANPFFCRLQIVIIQIDIQKVDVPGKFDGIQDVGFRDLPGDRQGRFFRIIVNIPIICLPQLQELFLQ